MLLASLLLVYLLEYSVAFVAFYCMLLLPIFSYILTLISVSNITITQALEAEPTIKEQNQIIKVQIKNKNIFSVNNLQLRLVSLKFGIDILNDMQQPLNLKPRTTYELKICFCSKYRGQCNIGLNAVALNDFLGLFCLKRKFLNYPTLTVQPKILNIGHFPISSNLLEGEGEYSKHIPFEDDYTTISDIRKYEYSDSFKKIHWKLSAKKNELIVKNYESAVINSVLLVFDNSPNLKGDDKIVFEDKMIEALVGVSNYCLRNNMPIILAYSAEVVKASGIFEFEKIYELCTMLEFDCQYDVVSVCDNIIDASNGVVGGGNIIIFTGNLNDLLFQRILRYEQYMHKVVLIYVVKKINNHSSKLYNALLEHGVDCYLYELWHIYQSI